MKLNPIETSTIDRVAEWMADKENYQWLDFGNGSQSLTAVALKVMTQRDSHCLRVFTSDTDETPIGLVALSNIAANFKTAMLWYVLGDKRYSGRGYTTRAVSQMLACAFRELGLEAVKAWAVAENEASIRVLKRNHFRFIGKLRQCHYIDGRASDRLLFDLLASEYR